VSEALPIAVEPALAEEAVLRGIVGHPAEARFRRERDAVYALRGDARERAFRHLHDGWFRELGLGAPLEAALGELPILAGACTRCVVTRAPSRHEEGADLLVASGADAANGRTILVRLRPHLLATPEPLLYLLRRELLHVADMVDPAFRYEPSLPSSDGGPSSEHLLRERYRVLWNVSVVGRLARRGVAPTASRDAAEREFHAAFAVLGETRADVFRALFEGERPTHPELLALAAPRTAEARRELGAGGRCPLCRFPTYAPETAVERLSDAAITAIHADFPAWRPEHGLCRQCADLYRAAAMSAAAAAQIPGAGILPG
jgi:hypothetical protein